MPVELYTPKQGDRIAGVAEGGLGDLVDDVRRIIQTSVANLDIVKAVAEDPALPKVAGKLREIRALEAKTTAPGQPIGIGLRRLDTALGLYIAVRKNPIFLYLGAALALSIPLLIGYAIGKRRRGSI